jgi:hypothetical protein
MILVPEMSLKSFHRRKLLVIDASRFECHLTKWFLNFLRKKIYQKLKVWSYSEAIYPPLT